MTPRTGRPRGRPRKAAEPKKSDNGRPRQPLAQRENRHLLALAQAILDHPLRTASDYQALRVFAAMSGKTLLQPLPTPENLAAMNRSEPFVAIMEARHSRAEPKLGAGQRHEDPFFGVIDDAITRPLRRFRTMKPDAPDRRWLALMSRCWRICLSADPAGEWVARELATAAGELAFYEERMRPLLGRKPLASGALVPSLLT